MLSFLLATYDVTRSIYDNFPKFRRTVPFVKRRKMAVFDVENLGDVLSKSLKSSDYDYSRYFPSF